MVRNRADKWLKALGVASAIAAASILVWFAGPTVYAQGFMRGPNLNIGPRVNPNIAGRVNPNIAGRVNANAGARINPNIGPRVSGLRAGVGLHLHPYVRYSPNLYPLCNGVSGDAACWDQPGTIADDGGGGAQAQARRSGPRNGGAQAQPNQRTIANQIVAEIDGSLSPAQADDLARRHGLARLQSQNFPLIDATVGLFRVTDRRSVDTASRELATEAGVRSIQPNFRYVLQQQKAKTSEADEIQYAVAKLRLTEAHKLSKGADVRVAVIDSGIDVRHPEFAGSIADSWDALGSSEGPHVHGTGVAGAIVAHVTVEGSAPAAKIIAIRAFGVVKNGAESSSFVLLKSFDYAASHHAQIINMSFAGPKDALIERGIAAMAAKGIVMVAAAGNAGPKSPPLYPGAYPAVIAVSGTDAQDRLFAASNRGDYITVAAPGQNIFLPAPDNTYQMTSGTSFSAAFVSGIAALLLERNPALKPDDVRAIVMKTARDLGAPGRDDLFGAGEADAYAAAIAAVPAPSVPVASSGRPAAEKPGTQPPSDQKSFDQKGLDDAPATRALASERSAPAEANRPAAQ
jgi:subtilisin family serine protease